MNPQAIVAILLTLVIVLSVSGTVYKSVFVTDGDMAANMVDHWKTVLSMIVGGLIAYIGVSSK